MIGTLLRFLGIESPPNGASPVPIREHEGKDEFRRALLRIEEVTAKADGRRPPSWEDLFPNERERRHES